DLNTLLARLDKAAESPHLNTKTRPFLESILCKPVNEAGNFRQNALDSPDCRKWFWNGWQNEESAACQILYKIADDLHVFEFNIESAGGSSAGDKSANDINKQLTLERNNLIRYIKDPSSLQNFNEETSRKSIAELQVAEDFGIAKFTNMDLNKRKVLVKSIATALRSRLEYEPHSVLYAAGGFSPSSIINYNAAEKGTRSTLSTFFGYSPNSIEEELQQLSMQLRRRMPEAVRAEFKKSEAKMQYFLPVLRKHMRYGSFSITYRRNLMELLAKLVSIPTSTAEVERGFSIYSVIRSQRRSRTTVDHLSNYLRIAISGPDKLSPYDFLQYPKKWHEDTGHQPADFPGATRGPGKKSLKRIEEEENFKSIFDPDKFLTQFYFYSDNVLAEEDFSENEHLSDSDGSDSIINDD
ncbi:unnamed protein product, partial [Cylicocyclus nassatus]